MQQTTIEGVRTLWADMPGPFRAALVVGIGARDETFPTSGLAHLLEHVVMSRIGRRPIDNNAEATTDATVFSAIGERSDVLQFLHDVCLQLARPDTARMAHEAKVIAIESGMYDSPGATIALQARFGWRGPGLAAGPEPALDQVTPEQLLDLVSRLVTRDNCVLAMTGPPGDDIRLPLPDAPARRAPEPTLLPRSTPAMIQAPEGAPVTLSYLTRSPAVGLATILRERLMDRLRHDLGISYDISDDTLPLQAGWLTAIAADFAPDAEPDVARVMREEVLGLANRPPDAGERAHAARMAELQLNDPTQLTGYLGFSAVRLLAGLPVLTPEEMLARELAELEPARLREAAAHAVATMLVHVPMEELPEVVGLAVTTELYDGPTFGDRRHRRRTVRPVPRSLEVSVGEDGISMHLRGEHIGAPWSDVVGVAHHEDQRMVVFADGNTVWLRARDFRDGQRLIETVDRATAGRRFHDPGIDPMAEEPQG
ncbi:putative Zn-dependent peptidase [Barrientosiimonas humi]|uniref:Peptidase M16 N-terminal domain-containing protein n=2 Tax=Barrientosiimonas TaxID=1535207 RepID=A0ABM8HFJ7_9MICO|nr:MULTISPECIES: insulinase family protein [Barrientosiimonas]TQL34680.1 putative Zn-dependent peptidase [Barrientosiimonas humi]BDZ59793.1 hypothetical protein GCM10025872_34500 [Barrientosiimonas endolithica]CAG7574670.1 hypothetical protein BH39T_PBIAJDOK_03326 [Barrientosiimonas humi]